MNLLLRAASLPFVKTLILRRFARCTADAFDLPPMALGGLSFHEGMERFARFSHEAVEQSARRGDDLDARRRRLHDGIRPLGSLLRRVLQVRGSAEIMQFGLVFYSALGIDVARGGREEITLRVCPFARHYSARTCQIMSALDEGVFAGLSDGGRLVFTRRITEGSEACALRFLERGGAI